MIIVEVKEIKFCNFSAPYNYVIDAQEWLKSFSIKNNIKSVVAENITTAIEMLQIYMQQNIMNRQYKAEDFEFTINYAKVEDGYFWSGMTSGCEKHPVKG